MMLTKSSGLFWRVYEVEEGKRSKYEIVDMIEAQRELLLKEISRMEDVGDDKEEQRTGNKCYKPSSNM